MTNRNPNILQAILALIIVITAMPSGTRADTTLERSIGFAVTIDPPDLSLSHSQKLSGKQSGGTLIIVITPDRKIKAAKQKCSALDLACQLETKVTTVMDGDQSIVETEVLGAFSGLNAESLKAEKRTHGDDTTLDASYRNDPEAAKALRQEGYEDIGLSGAKYDGEIYRLTRWSKFMEGGSEIPYGTATANLKIHADAFIDDQSAAFHGAFEAPQGIDFDLANPPAEAARLEAANRRYGEFKDAVSAQYTRAIEHLNKPRRLLNEDDKIELIVMSKGETAEFKKKIKIDWFGEPKTVKVLIQATLGKLIVEGLPPDDDGWSVEP